MVDRIQCRHCHGRGLVKLTGVYAETLKDVRTFCLGRNALCNEGYVVSNRDAKHFGCNPTALNNRLAALERLGFVRSEVAGRQRRFYPVK